MCLYIFNININTGIIYVSVIYLGNDGELWHNICETCCDSSFGIFTVWTALDYFDNPYKHDSLIFNIGSHNRFKGFINSNKGEQVPESYKKKSIYQKQSMKWGYAKNLKPGDMLIFNIKTLHAAPKARDDLLRARIDMRVIMKPSTDRVNNELYNHNILCTQKDVSNNDSDTNRENRGSQTQMLSPILSSSKKKKRILDSSQNYDDILNDNNNNDMDNDIKHLPTQMDTMETNNNKENMNNNDNDCDVSVSDDDGLPGDNTTKTIKNNDNIPDLEQQNSNDSNTKKRKYNETRINKNDTIQEPPIKKAKLSNQTTIKNNNSHNPSNINNDSTPFSGNMVPGTMKISNVDTKVGIKEVIYLYSIFNMIYYIDT